jgi:hypothetical protein
MHCALAAIAVAEGDKVARYTCCVGGQPFKEKRTLK